MLSHQHVGPVGSWHIRVGPGETRLLLTQTFRSQSRVVLQVRPLALLQGWGYGSAGVGAILRHRLGSGCGPQELSPVQCLLQGASESRGSGKRLTASETWHGHPRKVGSSGEWNHSSCRNVRPPSLPSCLPLQLRATSK